MISFCNRVIAYSFYALFFLVPLVFSGNTSELFELNKMWLTFGLTILICTAWASKMVVEKKITVQRTPIDILLLLFLLSQIISSIFSLDQHVSWWGYYSRFNGGLLSTICYILLYYAFVTNLKAKHALMVMVVSLFSGLCVSLWGFPSHFGADPTCFLFRGSFDTSCWTSAFQPTVRAFSTLGQPEWLAAYMAFLLPISLAYVLKNKKNKVTSVSFLCLTILFYLLLIFSDTRAGFVAFWIANIVFWVAVYCKKMFSKRYFIKMFVIINLLFLLSNYFFGIPFSFLNKYTFTQVSFHAAPASPPPTQTTTSSQTAQAASASEGGTDSGVIRLLVWQGAIRAWEKNPIFGTGVETFAFAYYRYKLPAHNLTSEWDYLYNKAHNEYLNYLATTGIFGLATYLGFIGVFFFATGKWFLNKHRQRDNEASRDTAKSSAATLVVVGILAGYISILISDFFGFSVVIINLYIFLSPAFVFMILGLLNQNQRLVFPNNATHNETQQQDHYVNPYQWTVIVIFFGAACWMIFGLIWYREADIAYSLGLNYDLIGNYKLAYPNLVQAVQMVPTEPVYQDEMSVNLAALSADLYSSNYPTQGAEAAKNAIALSNNIVMHHPNNVVYWKDRVRVFYTLSAADKAHESQYLQAAIQAINVAQTLAPTDAKISYNQGVLYGQAGDLSQAVKILNNTIKLKPDYIDAYVALGLFYHELAIGYNGKVINQQMQQNAINTYTYILKNISPNDGDVKKSLEEWRTNP